MASDRAPHEIGLSSFVSEGRDVRLATILEAASDFVGVSDVQGRTLFLNRAGRRMAQVADDADVRGLPIARFHPPDVAERLVNEALPATMRDGEWRGETAVLALDGTVIPVSQVIIAHRDGETGEVLFLSTIARDIREPKRVEHELRQALAERAELEQKLLQVQKLESIGRLAGGVAHDFNNVLTAILGYVTLAEYTLPSDHQAARSLEGIKEVVGRGATLTRQLLAFARRQIVQPVVLDLHDLVAKLQHVLRRLLREDVELSLVLLAHEPRVRIDPGQLEQVLMNLAVNARDAMPSGGRLVLETSELKIDDELARQYADLAPGPYALLRVIDSGSGMSAEVRRHAFEPFFTTKPLGVGTGLGLATCYGIVKQAGGHVFLESEEGSGTTVGILLPLVTDAVDVLDRAAGPESGLRGRGTLLVVEDDAIVRSVMVEGLRIAGYEVLEAATPQAARMLYAERRGHLDAIVADIVLPGSSGPELVFALRAHRPELPVVFVTGHSDHVSARDAVPGAHTAVLAKPFRNDELVRTLRTLIDPTRGAAAPGTGRSRP